MMSSARQPKVAAIQNSTGLRKARPKYWPIEYTPVAVARSACGNQVPRMRLFEGKAGASATPSPMRHAISDHRLVVKPCSSVNADQIVTDRK